MLNFHFFKLHAGGHIDYKYSAISVSYVFNKELVKPFTQFYDNKITLIENRLLQTTLHHCRSILHLTVFKDFILIKHE